MGAPRDYFLRAAGFRAAGFLAAGFFAGAFFAGAGSSSTTNLYE